MKKIFFISLFLLFTLFISGCSSGSGTLLDGFYQSEFIDNAYIIQISVDNDKMTFVEYINNREVDNGEYKITGDINNKEYQLIGEIQTSDLSVNKNNSFEIIIENLNEGKPIELNRIGKVPASFSQQFDDVDKYKLLISQE